MTDLDSKIKAALESASEKNVYLGEDKSTYRTDIAETFSGKYKFLFVISSVKLVAAEILAIFSIYQFFMADQIKEMLAYGFLTTMCAISIATIYLFFWQDMSKNQMNRESKRLELQISLLIDYLKERDKSG